MGNEWATKIKYIDIYKQLAMSAKFAMRLNSKDLEKINTLKELHRFEQTSDLIRYLITKELESSRRT